MGEARSLIPKHGFKFREEDVSHDFAKQKELHETHNAANEYPHFQYFKDNENLYHIGNLEALKAFLSSPPLSLALHTGEVEIAEEDLSPLLLSDKEKNENSSVIGEEGVSKEEEEEKEPALGIISASLQTVEGVVKYSTSWFTSWFYSPPTVTPIPSDPSPSDPSPSDILPSSDVKNDNEEDVTKVDEVKDENKAEAGEEGELRDFKVVQTNWYWRQQNRVLRFDLKNKTMYRYDPLDLTIRAIHPFTTLKDITCYNSQYFFQLTFYKSESDPTLVYEYYTTSSSDYPLILSLLTAHSSVAPNVLP